MDIISTVVPLIITNNLVLSAVKWLADGAVASVWLRVALAALSVIGVVSVSALKGEPVDFNSLTSLGSLLLQAAAAAIGSHLSYKAIKNA